MARDEGLEELLRGDLDSLLDAAGAARKGMRLSEKSMFGGRAWLVNGNLLCAARDDGMLARLGKGQDGWALQIEGIGPMISRGKRMQGWVRAGSAAFGDDALRHRLLQAALAFARSLPAK